MNPLFLEILVGVLIIVMAQFVIGLSIKPLLHFKNIIRDISERLAFNSRDLTSGRYNSEVSDHIRNSASNLEAAYVCIPFRTFYLLIGLVPSEKAICTVCKSLYQLSISSGEDSVDKCIECISRIKKLLKIDICQ